MKSFTTLLASGVLLGSPVFLQAKITRTVEKTFTVQPGGDLKVQTSGGDIQVLTGTDNEVKVTARQKINTDSEARADELLKDLDLTIEQQANNVTAKAKYGKGTGWHWGSTPVTVSFTVVVPKHYNVDLNTSGGDIGLESISGQARLRTSGGNLKLDRIEGAVDGGTSGGDISLREGTASVKLNTSGGNIHVDRAGGEADLSTSGGDIVIDSVRGRLSASTSGGDIRASIEGSLKGSCDLSTSGGNVTVSVEKSAAFDLKSRTSGGNVDADGLTIAIEKGGLRKSSLSGKVNGGGPELSLGTSGGDIRIRAK
jgi:Putative adhesin